MLSRRNGRTTLPQGVVLHELSRHDDSRGSFSELFREEWGTGFEPVQWNAVRSAAGVLRGVHVHVHHDDYLTVLEGHASIGLHDLRPNSPTRGMGMIVPMVGERPAALLIPAGVAHGFLFHRTSWHVYAVSDYWDEGDELGCRWDDPELGIDWPGEVTEVSERDRAAPSLAELVRQLEL